MLVLSRKDGEWIEITHRSGDVIRIRVYGIKGGPGEASKSGRAKLAFDDLDRNFAVARPEAILKTRNASPGPRNREVAR